MAFLSEMLGAIEKKDPRYVMLTRPLLDEEQEPFTELPRDHLGDLSQIRVINIRNHRIERLPSWIREMKNLVWLDMTDNPMIELPEEIGELSSLRVLRLSDTMEIDLDSLDRIMEVGNQLSYVDPYGLADLPASLARLDQLMYLRINGGRLEKIPDCVFALKNLDYLDLGMNFLTEIPEQIGDLTELTYLQLSKNNFRRLPESLGRLKKLQRLRLDGLHLETLPDSIGELNGLVSLEICHGILDEIPDTIKKLQNLKYFYLYNTPLSEADKNRLKALLPDTEIHFSWQTEEEE